MAENLKQNLWAREIERPFLRKVTDWIGRVQTQSRWVLTDFLTPRETLLLTQVSSGTGVVIEGFGGYDDAERVRHLIMPDEWYPSLSDFEIKALSVETGTGSPISHGSLLGSLLGLGIERRKVGDIAVVERTGTVLVCKDIVSFVLSEWRQVGRDNVVVSAVGLENISWSAPNYVVSQVNLLSLRADAMVAQACHFSRSQAQEAIARGLVSLNHVPLTKVDESVEEGDVLSVRGFGRVKVMEIGGRSRKDRLRVTVGVLKSSAK